MIFASVEGRESQARKVAQWLHPDRVQNFVGPFSAGYIWLDATQLQMGSDGFDWILPFQTCRGSPCTPG